MPNHDDKRDMFEYYFVFENNCHDEDHIIRMVWYRNNAFHGKKPFVKSSDSRLRQTKAHIGGLLEVAADEGACWWLQASPFETHAESPTKCCIQQIHLYKIKTHLVTCMCMCMCTFL